MKEPFQLDLFKKPKRWERIGGIAFDLGALATIILFILWFIGAIVGRAHAKDDGRYANSDLKQWFDSLQSGKGFCCAQADGHETTYKVIGASYYVPDPKNQGKFLQVPDEALIRRPNLYGRALVWFDYQGNVLCFLPGGGF